MSDDSSNALGITTSPTTSQAFIVPGSTNFTHHQLHLHQGHSGKLPSGRVGSGMRAGGTSQSSASYTWAKGQVWVLLGAGRAQKSSCIPGEGIHGTQPAMPWALPASTSPAPANRAHGARGWGPAPGGCASTNRLVEEGTERVKVQCDLLGAEYTEMLRLTQHRTPKCLAKH